MGRTLQRFCFLFEEAETHGVELFGGITSIALCFWIAYPAAISTSVMDLEGVLPRLVWSMLLLICGTLQLVGLIRNCRLRRPGSFISFCIWLGLVVAIIRSNYLGIAAIFAATEMLAQGWVFWRLKHGWEQGI